MGRVLHAITADGLPALGWHRGVEEGRLCVALGSGGGGAGGLDGYQYSGVLGRAAAGLLLFSDSRDVDYAALDVHRPCMGWRELPRVSDPWSELRAILEREVEAERGGEV